MTQPAKQSDLRGQAGQNVKGTTHVQAIRPTDQNVKAANRPQSAEGQQKTSK